MSDWFDKAKQQAMSPASEVIDHLYKTLLAMPSFRLSDGTVATTAAFTSPRVTADGDVTCGVDVLLGDEGHLELTLTTGGWGRRIDNERRQRPQRPHGRG